MESKRPGRAPAPVLLPGPLQDDPRCAAGGRDPARPWSSPHTCSLIRANTFEEQAPAESPARDTEVNESDVALVLLELEVHITLD